MSRKSVGGGGCLLVRLACFIVLLQFISCWILLHRHAVEHAAEEVAEAIHNDISPALKLAKKSLHAVEQTDGIAPAPQDVAVGRKLAYICILSTAGDKYRSRRQVLRDTWLRWVTHGEFGPKVDYGFHIVLCKDKANDKAVVGELRKEWQQHGDLTLHKSKYNTRKIVLDHRPYEFCGLEAEHRLQVVEYVLALPVKYGFVSTADDDGLLCMPSFVRDLELLPPYNVIWGKFWCKLRFMRPDSNWITFSADLLKKLAVSLRDWGLKPLDPPKGEPRKTPEELGTRLPFGIAIARILTHYIQKLGERVHVLDDRERIDTQQDWLFTYLQGTTFPSSKIFKEMATIFRTSVCKRLVWVHRATDRALVDEAYQNARNNSHSSWLTAKSLSLSPADICTFSRRLPHEPNATWEPDDDPYSMQPGYEQWRRLSVSRACVKSFEPDEWEDDEWMQEMCSHRFIFLRGQHAGALDLVRSLLSTGASQVLSTHGDADWIPQVPNYEGQYLQTLWPWDKPTFLRACFCGCSSEDDWVCWYLCPDRTEAWSIKARARALFYSWRTFWDMTKPVQLEQSPEMGARHVLHLFPEVSTLIFVMRHPLLAKSSPHSLACMEPLSMAQCVGKWLFMWSRIPLSRTLIVRFENAKLQPEVVRILLQRAVGLDEIVDEQNKKAGLESAPLADAGSAPASEADAAEDMVQLALDDGLWQLTEEASESTAHQAADLARLCARDSICSAAIEPLGEKIRSLGYNLLEPAASQLGRGWPFVNISFAIADAPAPHVKMSDCKFQHRDKCNKAKAWLDQYYSSCDDAKLLKWQQKHTPSKVDLKYLTQK
mmetsp:Transcript_17758/g.41338  ORF Transcript_17758/g.41338 Transcript_17758/m.41338 type:complete len:826 (-) Transcript_17758:332-2809(-)